jgi:hypothetical protein
MTTRSAVLLNCPGNGTNFLNGVATDIESYEKHLLSDMGGNWYKNEISTITSPTRTGLINRLNLEREKDILYIFFCGHGYYAKPSNQQMLCLARNEEIDAAVLLGYGRRVFLVTDSCQEIIMTAYSEARLFRSDVQNAETEPKNRRRFNSMIDDLPIGASYHAKACAIDELAGEDERGGLFSQALIEECRTRASNRQDFNLCNNFQSVADSVSRKSGGRQNPKLTFPRSNSAMTFVFGMR